MGLKGYRLWVMGQLDSNVQSPTEVAALACSSRSSTAAATSSASIGASGSASVSKKSSPSSLSGSRYKSSSANDCALFGLFASSQSASHYVVRYKLTLLQTLKSREITFKDQFCQISVFYQKRCCKLCCGQLSSTEFNLVD
jgi:hypothetical protein